MVKVDLKELQEYFDEAFDDAESIEDILYTWLCFEVVCDDYCAFCMTHTSDYDTLMESMRSRGLPQGYQSAVDTAAYYVINAQPREEVEAALPRVWARLQEDLKKMYPDDERL